MRAVSNPNDNILEIPGIADINEATALRDSLLCHWANSDHLTLDLGAVEVCDTASIQVPLAAQRYAESLSKTCQLKAASEPVLKMVRARGVSLGEIGQP